MGYFSRLNYAHKDGEIQANDELVRDAESKVYALCLERLHAIYGADIPISSKTRLQQEIDIMRSKKTATLYLIEHEIISKARENGMIFASCGADYIAYISFLLGISEIDPLPAHYYCSCQSSDQKGYIGNHKLLASWGLPKRCCPHCGKTMKVIGFDLPTELQAGPSRNNRSANYIVDFAPEDRPVIEEWIASMAHGRIPPSVTIPMLLRGYVSNSIESYKQDKGFMSLCELKSNRPILSFHKKYMQRTGVRPEDIPLNDISVYEAMQRHKTIRRIMFGKQDERILPILREIVPMSLEDLCIVFGIWLSDAWDNNLELDADFDAESAIYCRESLYYYLADHGFRFSEDEAVEYTVRISGGEPLDAEVIQTMIKHHVPSDFLSSVVLYQYIYPKAHLISLAITAYQSAWYVLHSQ